MTTLGHGGPPVRALSVPDLDLNYDEISQGELIGRGGSGVVHKVAITRNNRQTMIAVKQPEISRNQSKEKKTISKEKLERFSEEAELWDNLTKTTHGPNDQRDELHPQDHIVNIIDRGEGLVPWVAMEYMNGGNLRDLLNDGPLPLDQALWLVHCVCRAVRYAHHHGVVHHDIKPENILLQEVNGRWALPKVSDWGLAKVLLDSSDEMKGLTPTYAAPEQFAPGRFGSADWKTDVYQIGALAYELVAGQHPFDGSAAEIEQMKLSQEPIPPSKVTNADIPEAVDEAIMPALRRSKGERYDSIDYFRDELLGLFEIYHETAQQSGMNDDSHEPGFVSTTDTTDLIKGRAEDEQTGGSKPQADSSHTATRSRQNEETVNPSSWNEYRRELEQRQSGFLFSTLPQGLCKVLYQDLVTEVEQAESRRERTQSDVEDVKLRARELRDRLKEELYEALHLGQPLPDQVIEDIDPLEDTIARIDGLLRDQVIYLRSDEQHTLTSLHEELIELEAYIKAKQKLDKEIDEISSALDETEEEIKEALKFDRLLTDEEELKLFDELSDASRLIRTARRELTTDPLTDQDIARFDELIQREKSLRQRVADHNETVVQQEFNSHVSEAVSVYKTFAPEIIQARKSGESLARPYSEYLVEFEPQIEAVENLLEPERQEYLSSSQPSSVRKVQKRLTKINKYVEARQQLDEEVDDSTQMLDVLETEISEAVNVDRLLTGHEERTLLERIDYVEDRIESSKTKLQDTSLTDIDLQLFDEFIERVESLRNDVSGHNNRHTQQVFVSRCKKAAATWSEIAPELKQAKARGDALPRSRNAYFGEIDPQLDATEMVLASRKREYLSSEDIAELDRRHKILQTARAFVRAKANFEKHLERIRPTATKLRSTKDDYLDCAHYLTADESKILTDQIERLQDRLITMTGEVRLDRLGTADRECFDEYLREVRRSRIEVEEYNCQFLSQERGQYTGMFDRAIGGDHSLNQNQELAIYRNEIHNRVVAGAGTGKTFSLVCRIKYLLEKSVSPEKILALTFNEKAKAELEERLDSIFGITNVDCRTLHSFGFQMLQKANPDLVTIEDESRLREVERLVRKHRDTDPEFRNHYEEFIDQYTAKNLSSDEKTRKEFYDSLHYQSGVTLRGEDVDSKFEEIKRAHTTIADFLLKHGIKYQYRQYADWADNPGGKAYIPDFTLSDSKLIIEYLPSEQTQAHQKSYRRKCSKSVLRSIFEDTEWRFVTISGDATSTDSIAKLLRYHLDECDVTHNSPLTGSELYDTVYEHGILKLDVIKLFAKFIKKARINQVDVSTELESLDADEDQMLFDFSHAAARLVEPYIIRYRECNAFDYVDMILRATTAVQDGRVDHSINFDHVVVDEFQDLNLAQIQLIKSIMARCEDAHLFAVGDDWQSIYGFKGARPDYFVNFDDHFEPASVTRLEINYRCPPAVVKAGNDLIENNEIRTKKVVSADKSGETTITAQLIPGSDTFQYVTNVITRVGRLVRESIADSERLPGDIMILARNEVGSPFIRRISKHLKNLNIPVGGREGVSVMTAHKAKGREAEHVIVTNVVEGEQDGFPVKNKDRSLTEIVDIADESTLDEERRLFYVALTRTKDRLDIQTRINQQSSFLNEIQEYVEYQPVLADFEQKRANITATARDTIEKKSWLIRQMGKLESDDGYELKYIVPDSATDAPLLQDGERYRLENVRIGEYDGHPQFEIDDETAVLSEPTQSPAD